MPPKQGPRKVNKKVQDEKEEEKNCRAEQKRVFQQKQSCEQQELKKLNVLLHEEEILSQSDQDDRKLLFFKAQLKQLREKLVCS